MGKALAILMLCSFIVSCLGRTPYHPASGKGAAFCRFRGRYHIVGDVWAFGDGCNKCTCYDGNVGCTANYCNL